MKVHFIKENSLEALRTNLKDNLKHYSESSNEWIYEYFDNDNPFIEYKYEFPDFELKCEPTENNKSIDVYNTITLYSAMKSLTDTQATDERLWSGMCHCDFWSFLHKRWKIEENSMPNYKNVQTRYFFAHNKKRSLITNSLSRLWWVGHLTYDQTRQDPFELTKYFITDYSTKVFVLFSNNYTSNNNITIGLLSAIKQLEESGFTIRGGNKRKTFYEAAKYLNVLGGYYILDYFTADEICEKVTKHLKSLY